MPVLCITDNLLFETMLFNALWFNIALGVCEHCFVMNRRVHLMPCYLTTAYSHKDTLPAPPYFSFSNFMRKSILTDGLTGYVYPQVTAIKFNNRISVPAPILCRHLHSHISMLLASFLYCTDLYCTLFSDYLKG